MIFISDEVTNFVRHLGNICKGRIYEAVNKDDSIRDKHLLELEVSAFSDGIAMQFIRYYHNDYNVTLEEIIECGKQPQLGFCHHLVPQIGVLHLRDILEKGVRDEYNIKQRLFQWYRPTTQD